MSESQAFDDAAVQSADAALAAAITGPRRVQGDAGMVEQFSMTDLIAMHRYLAAIAARKLRRRGLRFNVFQPPAAVGHRAGELGGGDGNHGQCIQGGYPD